MAPLADSLAHAHHIRAHTKPRIVLTPPSSQDALVSADEKMDIKVASLDQVSGTATAGLRALMSIEVVFQSCFALLTLAHTIVLIAILARQKPTALNLTS